jgi:SAM-dependent methyltransferase
MVESTTHLASESEHIPYELSGVAADRYQMQPITIARLLAQQVRSDGLDPRDLTVLDFACGRGELLQRLAELGFRVRGMDDDPTCVSIASGHGPCIQGGLGALGTVVPAKSVDILVASHILEHLPNPIESLARFASVARSYVFVAVPNLTSWWFFRSHLLRRDPQPPLGHIMGWDWAHLRILLTHHAGLTIAREWGFQIAVIPVAGLERVLPGPLKGLARALDRALQPLHYQWLPRLFPRVAHQIMVICRVPPPR